MTVKSKLSWGMIQHRRTQILRWLNVDPRLTGYGVYMARGRSRSC
jgi:hypothetical protein